MRTPTKRTPEVTTTEWTNWSGTVKAQLIAVETPESTEAVAAIVREAASRGVKVKAVGSGHSFTSIAATDGVQIRMTKMNQIVSIDDKTGLVTVQAGIPLHELNPQLAARGWAMENLGDIDRQTISGATSTGTHGTGAKLGGISTQIRGLEIVLADGSVTTCSPTENPQLFAAARIGLGAFGIITQVTLQCVPSYVMHATDEPMPLAEVLDRLDQLVDDNDHFEFFWFPHSDVALTRRNTRLPSGTTLKPLKRWQTWVDDTLATNVVFERLMRFGTRFPRSIPRITRISAGLMSGREYVDSWENVFAFERNVKFREGEFAIPRAAVADVIREFKRYADSSGEKISFPLEVRFAAPDDIWLSTAYERDTAYVAFHQYHRMPHETYFAWAEELLRSVGGRPHWGKMHNLEAADLSEIYPRFDDFVALRDELDPNRVFGNDYLDRVLGA